MLTQVLNVILFFCAASIIGLVLVQRGKGADAGAGFGAGASGTVFGARGARTALSRATAVLAAIFMLTCLLLTYVARQKVAEPTSVLDKLATEAPAAAPAVTPAAPTTTVPATVAPATIAPVTTAPASTVPPAK
jgi:preprotein translocase subunit SecG